MERQERNLISVAVVAFCAMNLCNAALALTYVDPGAEFAITAGSGRQADPAIWGDWVVWYDLSGQDGQYNIYAENLLTHEEVKLTGPGSSIASDPDIYDGLVVWNDWRNGNSDIYQYDLRTRTESVLYSGLGDQLWPAIHGDTVVWGHRDGISGPPEEVWGYSISQDETFLISDAPGYKWYPDVSGDTVVWGDYRNGNWDIFGYDLSADTEFEVATGPDYQRSAAVHGDKVVYEHDDRDHQGLDDGFGIYDLNTDTHITHESPGANDGFDIYGDIALWNSRRTGGPYGNGDTDGYDIFGYNAATDEEFLICAAPGDQGLPAIYENIVVWTDGRSGDWYETDIYGNTIVPEPATLLLFSLGAMALRRKPIRQ